MPPITVRAWYSLQASQIDSATVQDSDIDNDTNFHRAVEASLADVHGAGIKGDEIYYSV